MSKQISSSVRVRDARQMVASGWNVSLVLGAVLLGGTLVSSLVQADPRRTEVDPPSPGGSVWISVSDASMPEGNGGSAMLRFKVTASEASSEAVHISYRVVDRSATCGDNDYQAISGVLTLAPDQTTAWIAVAVYGDHAYESDENFWLVLDQPANALITDGVANGTIFNDDRGGGGGPRRLPDLTESESAPRLLPDAPLALPALKKATTWGGLKALYR